MTSASPETSTALFFLDIFDGISAGDKSCLTFRHHQCTVVSVVSSFNRNPKSGGFVSFERPHS